MARPRKKIAGQKNALWQLYLEASPMRQLELRIELKRVDLLRHWQGSASVEGYNIKHAPYPLRDLFVRLFPESAIYFPETDDKAKWQTG